jgi:hypothetical protein
MVSIFNSHYSANLSLKSLEYGTFAEKYGSWIMGLLPLGYLENFTYLFLE